jgi:hypothetical protein
VTASPASTRSITSPPWLRRSRIETCMIPYRITRDTAQGGCAYTV